MRSASPARPGPEVEIVRKAPLGEIAAPAVDADDAAAPTDNA
jgi:hypothetical protein